MSDQEKWVRDSPDVNWSRRQNDKSYAAATLQVVQNVRDLQKTTNELLGNLVNIFNCRNAQEIPIILRRIDANTRKPKRKAVKK